MNIAENILVREIRDAPEPLRIYEAFKHSPFSFFLDSGMDHAKLGRYSFIGGDPFLVMKSRGREVTLLSAEGPESVTGNPFDILCGIVERYRLDNRTGLPFAGGAVGYLSYDLGHFIERLPATAVDDLQLPECCFGFYDSVIVFDHLEGKTFIAAAELPGLSRIAADRLRQLRETIERATGEEEAGPLPLAAGAPVGLRSNFTHDEYLAAVEAAREYIRAGDIFQVNISQRFEADMPLPPYELYKRLRGINPAPFASYLNFDEVVIVSASPERFLRLQGRRVETRPIKGTRPRGKDPVSDSVLAGELTRSVKDRAEHMMIVDLERNDLGRVCQYGTVKVSELTALERYATVFHLTSTVEGRLRPEKSVLDLLKATFPGGSITGAPKVRAMEIIDTLEPTRRSVYTGSIGYLGFDGDLDLNIVIRTILVKGGKAYFQVGGAVVYDSDPQGEYDETLDKARALINALDLVPQVVSR